MSSALPEPWRRWAMFLDFDGTLVEIAARPDLVRLSPRTAETLERIRTSLGGAVALISGRSLDDLDTRTEAPWLAAAGIHGLERRTAEGRIVRVAADVSLDLLRNRISGPLAELPGVLREDKGLAIALHWRMAARHEKAVNRIVRDAVADLPDIALVSGKCVLEARAKGADKGSAIAAFMAEAPFNGRIPVFVGDDRTDEDGFAFVADQGGVTIKVGEGQSRAEARIRDPAALRAWLSFVARALENPGGGIG